MEFWRFIFSSFWIWLGFMFILGELCDIIVKVLCVFRKINYNEFFRKSEDDKENEER